MSQCYCVNINDFDWDQKEFVWRGKYFYVLPIKMFFHNPSGLDYKINELISQVKMAKYEVEYPVQILLQDGKFKGSLMVEIKNPKEGDSHLRMIEKASGKTYISRLPFSKIKKDVAKIISDYQKNGTAVKNVFLWYVNCPACTSTKGYKTVIFVQSA